MVNTIDFTITGRPASKKNSRRNFGHISLPSIAFEKFKEDALWQLKKIKREWGIKNPIEECSIEYIFYQKGKLTQDPDNAICSINDVLQDAGIILDDKNIIQGHWLIERNAKEWQTSVKIEARTA